MRACGPRRLAVIFVTAICLSGPARSSEFDPLSEVWKYLGGQITLDTHDGQRRIEYCPDNTCDIFFNPENREIGQIQDFVFLYYNFVHSYNYPWMEKFRENQTPDNVRRVLERHSAGCALGDGFSRCVLVSLANKGQISIGFARYDEGARHESESDLQATLDRALIPSMVQRYDVAR